MNRTVYNIWIGVTVSLFVVCFFFAIGGVLTQGPGLVGEKFAGLATVFGISGVVSFFAQGMSTNYEPPPRGLSRAGRKELRQQEERVELERRIAELERETGIR